MPAKKVCLSKIQFHLCKKYIWALFIETESMYCIIIYWNYRVNTDCEATQNC